VKLFELVIERFKTLRAMIQQQPLGSAAADLVSDLEEYQKRLFGYRRKTGSGSGRRRRRKEFSFKRIHKSF